MLEGGERDGWTGHHGGRRGIRGGLRMALDEAEKFLIRISDCELGQNFVRDACRGRGNLGGKFEEYLFYVGLQ